jgi:hypothetical protein
MVDTGLRPGQKIGMQTPTAEGVDRLRRLLRDRPELVAPLGLLESIESFARAAAGAGASHGVEVAADAIQAAVEAVPAFLGPQAPVPLVRTDEAPAGWLPVGLFQGPQGPMVSWRHFGETPLSDAFFETTVRLAMVRPMTRFMGLATLLEALPETVARRGPVVPDGLIFHMSRCGSTLVSQMLAANGEDLVVSEAGAIDQLVMLERLLPGSPPDRYAAWLRAGVMAFAQAGATRPRRFFLKLDAWHALALPLFRRAFPDTPWVFLYREPLEVMVSQARARGPQLVPALFPPSTLGLDPSLADDEDDYAALVLARVCEAAADAVADGGMLVNYARLPHAVFDRILPHFGIDPDPGERAAMMAAARFDVKQTGVTFVADGEGKRREVSEAMAAVVARRLGPVHAKLERLRQAAESPDR